MTFELFQFLCLFNARVCMCATRFLSVFKNRSWHRAMAHPQHFSRQTKLCWIPERQFPHIILYTYTYSWSIYSQGKVHPVYDVPHKKCSKDVTYSFKNCMCVTARHFKKVPGRRGIASPASTEDSSRSLGIDLGFARVMW